MLSTEELIVAGIAIVIGSLLKSISGLGLPLVTIPAVSYVADIETAVAITALPNLTLNGALAWRERTSWSQTRDLPALGAAGLAGAALLAVHQPIAYLVATPIVFAGGWAWPGLFNLVVVQANRSAPAAATARANPKPMPPLPPVMTATFPVRSNPSYAMANT